MDNQTLTVFNEALSDELIVINAVYGDGTAIATYSDADHTTVEVRLEDDEHSFYVRFPSNYPAVCPSLIGSHPLHLSSNPVIANQVCFFRACIVVCHLPDEASFYESIVVYDDIRQAYRKLSPGLAETLCRRKDPAVRALHEQLSALAEATQSALQSIMSPPEPSPQISECSVCLEPVFTPLAAVLPHCCHAFCSACLQSGVKNVLKTRALFKCCGQVVPAKTVAKYAALDHASTVRYATYIDEKSDPNPIFCHSRICSAYIPAHCINELGARCPACKGLTCEVCKQRVHKGLCATDGKMLKQMAKEKRWKFCPGCAQLVERVDGCKSVKCLCGVIFCYNCGRAAPKGVLHVDGRCCLDGQMFDTMARGRR